MLHENKSVILFRMICYYRYNLYRALDAFVTIGRSKALAKESLFYALDTAPVIICFFIFMWGHYGIVLPPDDDKLHLMNNVEVVVGSINIDQQSPRQQSVIPVRDEVTVPSAIHLQIGEEV